MAFELKVNKNKKNNQLTVVLNRRDFPFLKDKTPSLMVVRKPLFAFDKKKEGG